MKNLAKKLFLIGTFFSPFWFILPTNFSIYEFILLATLMVLLYNKNFIKIPDKVVLTMFILILLGYVTSIKNAHLPIEALKFPLQFFFITVIQLTLAYNLVETKRDMYQHATALIFSSIVVVTIALQAMVSSQWKIGDRLETVFGINPLAVVSMMLFFTSFIYFITALRKNKRISVVQKGWIYLVGIVSLMLVLVSLFTLSRRVIPAFLVGLFLLFGTKFLSDFRPKQFLIRTLYTIVGLPIAVFILSNLGFIPDELLLRVIETTSGDRDLTRSELWSNGITVFISLFPLGTGFNNFQYLADEILGQTSSSPHNIVINPLAEGGLLSGVGMLGLIIIFFKRFLNTLLEGCADPIVLSFAISTFCFFVAHIFGTAPTPRFYWLYIILGMISVSREFKN